MPYSRESSPLPAVALHAETVLRADGSRIELRLWRGVRGFVFQAEFRERNEVVLRYAGDQQFCDRTLRGRAAPYAFRSIEQLRYDFERDIEESADGDEAQA